MTGCFDKLETVIKDVEYDFPNKKANPESVNWLKQVCSMIDTIVDAYKGTKYRYKVDQNTLDITIGIECEEIIVDGFEVPNKFYEVASSAKKMYFEHGSDDDHIIIMFVFDGVWEDVE